MTAKEYLEELRYLNKVIGFKLEQIDLLKYKAEKCTAVLNKTPVSGTKVTDPMKIIDRFIDLENSLAQDIGRLLAKEAEITARLDGLENDLFKTILMAKYINFKSFEEIADLINYGYRHTKRLHQAALKDFEVKYSLSPHVP